MSILTLLNFRSISAVASFSKGENDLKSSLTVFNFYCEKANRNVLVSDLFSAPLWLICALQESGQMHHFNACCATTFRTQPVLNPSCRQQACLSILVSRDTFQDREAGIKTHTDPRSISKLWFSPSVQYTCALTGLHSRPATCRVWVCGRRTCWGLYGTCMRRVLNWCLAWHMSCTGHSKYLAFICMLVCRGRSYTW